MKLPLRGRLLVLAVVGPIAGCVMMGISWKELSVHSRLEKHGVQVVGVVDSSERKTSKRNSSYNMLVTYPVGKNSVQGRFTAKSDVAQAHPVQSPIDVVYDPNDPSVAKLKESLNPQEFKLLIWLGIGLFALGPLAALVAFRLRA